MKKISEILGKVTGKYDLTPEASASQVLLAAEEYLKGIFGESNVGSGKNIHAKKLQHGLLFFEVSSSPWNNRLFLEKMGLLEMLHKEFPKMRIEDIRGKVRTQ